MIKHIYPISIIIDGFIPPFIGSLHTGSDKRNVILQMKKENKDANIVYIGDSMYDILPALNADIGILLLDKPEVARFCKACTYFLQSDGIDG